MEFIPRSLQKGEQSVLGNAGSGIRVLSLSCQAWCQGVIAASRRFVSAVLS